MSLGVEKRRCGAISRLGAGYANPVIIPSAWVSFTSLTPPGPIEGTLFYEIDAGVTDQSPEPIEQQGQLHFLLFTPTPSQCRGGVGGQAGCSGRRAGTDSVSKF